MAITDSELHCHHFKVRIRTVSILELSRKRLDRSETISGTKFHRLLSIKLKNKRERERECVCVCVCVCVLGSVCMFVCVYVGVCRSM